MFMRNTKPLIPARAFDARIIWGAWMVPGNNLKERFHQVIPAITERVFPWK
jgi:hypothetical protein